jgi:hypothetical protein
MRDLIYIPVFFPALCFQWTYIIVGEYSEISRDFLKANNDYEWILTDFSDPQASDNGWAGYRHRKNSDRDRFDLKKSSRQNKK